MTYYDFHCPFFLVENDGELFFSSPYPVYQIMSSNDDRGGGGGDFVAGFLLGSAVCGTLAYIFAPQVIWLFHIRFYHFTLNPCIKVALRYLYIVTNCS